VRLDFSAGDSEWVARLFLSEKGFVRISQFKNQIAPDMVVSTLVDGTEVEIICGDEFGGIMVGRFPTEEAVRALFPDAGQAEVEAGDRATDGEFDVYKRARAALKAADRAIKEVDSRPYLQNEVRAGDK
jgi:hypothetical protein